MRDGSGLAKSERGYDHVGIATSRSDAGGFHGSERRAPIPRVGQVSQRARQGGSLARPAPDAGLRRATRAPAHRPLSLGVRRRAAAAPRGGEDLAGKLRAPGMGGNPAPPEAPG